MIVFDIQHGAIIVATGGEEYRGDEYGYGQSERIVTQMEFEHMLANRRITQLPDSVVMIQCVGPAEEFCSRICCTTALKNALKLKEINPNADVTILFRDIRTYGFKERLYTEARRQGIRFMQFEFDNKPIVQASGNSVSVKMLDPILGREIEHQTRSAGSIHTGDPLTGTRELASKLKISTDMDGFFLEAHVKLRPVDFSADGIFMAGMAHYPKFLDETIAQAQAAASRAAGILAQDTIMTNARVAQVDAEKCVGCLTCVRICPYEVPKISSDYTGVG